MSALGWTLLIWVPSGFAVLGLSMWITKKMDKKGMWD